MKSRYNVLFVIVAILFSIGVLVSAYNLYSLPESLERSSGSIDLEVIREIAPALNQTYFFIGLTLVFSIASIVLALLLQHFTEVQEKIVYVERSASKTDRETADAEQRARQDLEERIRSINRGLDTVKNTKERMGLIISRLCMKIDASQGLVFSVQKQKNKRYIELIASFAFQLPDSETLTYEFGEGLAGQVAKEGKKLNVSEVPQGYIKILSGLGSSSPNHLAILPVKVNGEVNMVAEIGSFTEISKDDESLVIESLKLALEQEQAVNRKNAKKELASQKSKSGKN